MFESLRVTALIEVSVAVREIVDGFRGPGLYMETIEPFRCDPEGEFPSIPLEAWLGLRAWKSSSFPSSSKLGEDDSDGVVAGVPTSLAVCDGAVLCLGKVSSTLDERFKVSSFKQHQSSGGIDLMLHSRRFKNLSSVRFP